MIHIYNNIDNAKIKLYDMVNLEEIRNRPYFVDNDFFDNKYNNAVKLKYFCIKEREVSEWCNYSQEKNLIKSKNKIIYFNNFK